jgi:ribokinase
MTETASAEVIVLGIFAADLAFTAERMPHRGETLIGSGFSLGPGGKGSNQAVAARRAGASTAFLSRVGKDQFGAMARTMWEREGIDTALVLDTDAPTGAAFIFVEQGTGENAIIVNPGAAALLGPADVELAEERLARARVFLVQLEQPVETAARGLELARRLGLVTILNPAPAAALPDAVIAECDYLTPNETEASALSGVAVSDMASAREAAAALLARGAGAVVVTLGAGGALFSTRERVEHVPAASAGPVVDTTGAGDAFNGAFACALAEGADPVAAVRFANAAAGISVTRPGTAPSMPSRAEIEDLMRRHAG